MASRAAFRLSLPLLVAAAVTALSGFTAGCQPEEHAVFITVRTEEDVDQLKIRTVILDPDNPRNSAESINSIGRTKEEINGDQPIRVTVELPEPREVMVHLEGINSRGIKVVATRCYPISGIITDEVRLVPLPSDLDGDGFVEDPQEACVAAAGGPCNPRYLCSAAVAGDCHERPSTPSEQACDVLEDGTLREPCDRDAETGCCDPPQDTYPGAPELCNDGIDQSCNQGWAPDDNGGDVACTDDDEDGFAKCSPFSVVGTCDCNDDDPTIRPMRAAETRTPCDRRSTEEQVDCDPEAALECENGRDEDCDGLDRDCDLDGDGFGTNVDCNDADPAINPGAAEVCTPEMGIPIDENCNGLIDELASCAPDDQDRDGTIACEVARTPGCDCNDCDSGIHEGATEICGDGIDQDCDGSDTPCDPADMDQDGFLPPSRDCDDTDPSTYSGAPERCGDGIDNDCDGSIDEGCSGDSDGDGWAEADLSPPLNMCEGDPDRAPGLAETCRDALDNNCNGAVNEVYSPVSGMYADGTEGCILCPVGTAEEWCDVDITGSDESSELAQRLSFQNCGGCRVLCSVIETNDCGDGKCVCTFNGDAPCAGSRCCATGCEEMDDPANCGACGSDCNDGRPASRPAADNCVDGSCACGTGAACSSGSMCCGGRCVAFDDPQFCGTCGSSCFDVPSSPADQDCVEIAPGAFDCVCEDPTNQADCDGNDAANGCETNLRNPTSINNCGGCGVRCSVRNGTPTCTAGTCAIASCDPNHRDCNGGYANGCETDIRTLANCGSCGSVCTTANATPTCASRSCQIQSCTGGWGDCSGGAANGCETRLNSLTNCGDCGITCSRANATPTCSTGTCAISVCLAGWGNCDGVDGNGCETRLNSLTNCGGCGVACSRANATAECSTGTCRIASCTGVYDNCNASDADGCERPTNTNSDCGSCGNNCSLPETCFGSTCDCTPAVTCSGVQNCDTQSDGCFGTISCGTCSGTDTCGGSGTPGICGCTPLAACTGGSNCGTQADGCGGTINCGSCSGTDTCGGGGTPSVCGCTALAACTGGSNCGTQTDGCGGTINCGSCFGTETCGGGGTAGVCGCTPLAACTGGRDCGTQADGCGGFVSCGMCTGSDICVSSMCTCVPALVCTGGQDCGTQDDGCGGSINCGICAGATNLCCDNQCTATNGSDAHCGGCDMPCPAGESCSGGACSP